MGYLHAKGDFGTDNYGPWVLSLGISHKDSSVCKLGSGLMGLFWEVVEPLGGSLAEGSGLLVPGLEVYNVVLLLAGFLCFLIFPDASKQPQASSHSREPLSPAVMKYCGQGDL